MGRRCHEVVHKTSEAPAFCLMRQAHADSTTSRMEQENEDGSTLEITVDTIYDEQGVFTGAVHFLRDITEAKKLRQQLIQSEKMVAVGQLVAGVAHEINNPLTGVLGFAQLLQTRDIDDQARRDAERHQPRGRACNPHCPAPVVLCAQAPARTQGRGCQCCFA